MFLILITLPQLIFPLVGKLFMVKTNQKGYMVNTGKQTHHKTPKLKPGRIGSGHDVEFGRDYAGVFPPITNNQGSVGSAPACSLATRCKVGRQGDRACGANSRCDRKQRVCVCNSPAQDYPNCCFPSCRGMDAVCVIGGPCKCIGNGKYPDCEEVCGEGCGDGEICKKVGGVAQCVCKSNFIRRGGVCKPCTQESGATMMESANSGQTEANKDEENTMIINDYIRRSKICPPHCLGPPRKEVIK